LVKTGDRVLTGQKIAEPTDFIGAPLHATVSGHVSAVTTLANPQTGQLVTALVIISDGTDKWIELASPGCIETLSVNDILRRIREAGVVGLGGGIFPTHVKLSPKNGKRIDTVILNGCESEPYITSDYRVMLEYGEIVLSGLNVIKRLLSPKLIYIAVEDNKPKAIEHLKNLILSMGCENEFKVVALSTRYPAGAEKVLVKLLLDREVPIGGVPSDLGVIVHNVSTAKAIHDAVVENKPLLERVVTITGKISVPKNVLVRLGTPLRDLIDYCGGTNCKEPEAVVGGPMMGAYAPNLDYPLTKGMGCVLIQRKRPKQELECIRCGKCLEVCPMSLMPNQFVKYAKVNRYDDCQKAYIEACFECGNCAYTCPSNIPIVRYIKLAKSKISYR
jgi:electron transport complex protein RnfC